MRKRIHVCKTLKWFKYYVRLMGEYRLHHQDSPYSGFSLLIRENTYMDKILSMSILKIDKVPVGVAIKLITNGMMGCNITCYISPDHRRKGYGSKLVNALIKNETEFEIMNYQFPDNFPKTVR